MRYPFARVLLLSACLVSFTAFSPARPSGRAGSVAAATRNSVSATYSMASSLYKKMSLRSYGLSQQALLYALKGYQKLVAKGRVRNKQYLTIIDFSQSSRRKRFYIIDLKRQKLVMNTYVAHGRNSGADKANRFSNRPESEQSSLGFYVTKHPYYGKHGLALRLAGVEKGINHNVERRAIVLHGSDYVNSARARSARMGRSQGCPALPAQLSSTAVRLLKGGSAMFVYHPSKSYVNRSSYLN